eukprot:gene32633-17646_t
MSDVVYPTSSIFFILETTGIELKVSVDDFLDEDVLRDPVARAKLEEQWSFELLAPQGLLRKMYTKIGVAPKAVPGLLKMADVLEMVEDLTQSSEMLVDLVRSWSSMLDPDLSFTLHPSAAAQQLHSNMMAPGISSQQTRKKSPKNPKADKANWATPSPGSVSASDYQCSPTQLSVQHSFMQGGSSSVGSAGVHSGLEFAELKSVSSSCSLDEFEEVSL